MDRESLRTVVAYSDINKQHFDGGYFSPAVREQAERVKTLNKADKQALYKDTFSEAQALASRLIEHPRYKADKTDGGGSIDLLAEGFGVIDIAVTEFEEEDESSPAFTTVTVSAEAFHPVADTYYEHGEMYAQTQPAYWEEGIYAGEDGLLTADMADDLDLHILRALDCVETLRIVDTTLNGRQ
jgi:hypothetical protein